MGTSGIEWTDATWNPIVGCSKVSPGCAHCYAETMSRRIAGAAQGRTDENRMLAYMNVVGDKGWTGAAALNKPALLDPLRWKKPRRVFVCSMSDLFHESVPDEWIDKVFNVMGQAVRHTFMVLTKRAARMSQYLNARAGTDGAMLEHIWIGVSAEDQKRSDERIPLLLGAPAAVRFVSAEPLLGQIDLRTHARFLDWAIIGCESGPKRRPCDAQWVHALLAQCQRSGVTCFVKQVSIDGKVSKDPNDWPQFLRVRNWPGEVSA